MQIISFNSFKLSVVVLACGLCVKHWLSGRASSEPASYAALRRLNVFPRNNLPVSYVPRAKEDYVRGIFSPGGNISEADTTAVVLNWSRYSNVVLISSLLCDPGLSSVIKDVFIWNNSPLKIIPAEIAQQSGCPKSKIRVYNSPGNLYFQARFIACSQSTSRYCFIQDDDYLVRPEIIFAIHAQLAISSKPRTIHLLPPHEHLSSSLHELHITDREPPIHTSFAWLGHGAFLHRAQATEFLALLHHLNVSEEEMKMADNYFTILSNRMPDIWFDQGIELGGGQPFTVGTEGQERNNRHILQATRYLEQLANEANSKDGDLPAKLPYVSWHEDTASMSHSTKAACRDSTCVLETNIRLLPSNLKHNAERATGMLRLVNKRLEAIGQDEIHGYIQHLLSSAIDGDPLTCFRSAENAKAGDYLSLISVGRSNLPDSNRIAAFELVLLIPSSLSVSIIENSSLISSKDGHSWCTIPSEVYCLPATISSNASGDLKECAFRVPVGGQILLATADCFSERYLRLILQTDVDTKWNVHELWTRALLSE